MKYTYALHENRVKYLQDILDKLIALYSAYDFHPNKEEILVTESNDTHVELSHFEHIPDGTIRFAHLSWIKGNDISFLHIQYIRDTKKVSDSTRWNANNEFLGGHIQISHNYRGSEEAFLQRALVLLNEVSTWMRLPDNQSVFA